MTSDDAVRQTVDCQRWERVATADVRHGVSARGAQAFGDCAGGTGRTVSPSLTRVLPPAGLIRSDGPDAEPTMIRG